MQIEYKKEIGDDWVTVDRKMLAVNPGIIEEIHTIHLTRWFWRQMTPTLVVLKKSLQLDMINLKNLEKTIYLSLQF